MIRTRLIISLLLDNECHLINTKKFGERTYLGDPLNAAYIFSHYEVDEMLILDIDASKNKRVIPYKFVKALSNFTTVPLSVGGGIKSLNQIQDLLSFGVEKVIIGENLKDNFVFLKEASNRFGSSSISTIINVNKNKDNVYEVFTGMNKIFDKDIFEVANICQEAGAGEIIINQINRDGMQMGFDLDLFASLNSKLRIPIVALGGCGKYTDIKDLLEKTNLSGIACSSIFVYAQNTKNVLLKYSEVKELIISSLIS